MDDQNPPCSSENPPQNPYPQTIAHKFIKNEGLHFSNEPNDDEYAAKMENFKAFIFKSAVLSSSTKSLSPMLRSLVEKRIGELFPDFHTPDHPPYAAMIDTAITTLNEDGGSTAEAISQFIKNVYADLPRAHDIFLEHHLKNLCDDGVVAKDGNRFCMVNSDVVPEPSPDRSGVHNQAATPSPNLSPVRCVRDESSPSPSSSSSWIPSIGLSSSSSFDSFPTPKKRRWSQGRKSVRKKGRKRKSFTRGTRIHLDRAAKRRGALGKKALVRKEIRLNAYILVSEGEIEESEKKTTKKKESQYSLGQKSARTRGRKRKSTTQGTRIHLDHAAKRRGTSGKRVGKEVQLNANNVTFKGEAKELEEQTVEKQECQYSKRQKSGRKSKRTAKGTRIHLDCAVMRKHRVCRKAVVGKETQKNSDILMLKSVAKESEEKIEGKDGHHVMVVCHDPVTGEKRTVIHIDLDELQDMVNEDPMEQDLPERSIPEDKNQADVLESEKQAQSHHIVDKEEQGFSLLKQAGMFSEFELHQKAKAAVAGQGDYSKDGQWEPNAKDEHQLIVKESFLKETDVEVIDERSLLEEHDFEIVKGERKEKKRFQPREENVKAKQVLEKLVKDSSAEESQPQAQGMEVSFSEDLTPEKLTEATQQQIVVNREGKMVIEDKIQGNECETFGCGEAEDFKIEIQICKPAMRAEVNASEEQHNLVMEVESQIIGGIGRCDDEQQHENLMDRKLGPSEKLTDEISEMQKKPLRQQNPEQVHQAERLTGSNKQEVEEAEMQNENPHIQQRNQLLEEENEAMVNISPVDHDAEKNSYTEATVLPRESFSPVLEEDEENISKENMEWQSNCLGEEETIKMCGMRTQQKPESLGPEFSKFLSPFLLQQPSQQIKEEKEEKSQKTIEQKRDSHAEEGNEGIWSKLKQQKPQFSSSPCSSKLKSQETSSEPQILQKPEQAEKNPQRQHLWDWIKNSFGFS